MQNQRMFKTTKLSLSTALAFISLSAFVGILPSSETQASRARPRTVAASENVRLALPRDLSEAADAGKMGLDFEPVQSRQKAMAFASLYVQHRRQSGRNQRTNSQFQRECEIAIAKKDQLDSSMGVTSFICAHDQERRQRPDLNLMMRRSKAERKDVASQLVDEHWEAVQDIPYQNVVGIVGSIQTKAELIKTGRTLSSKSECVGAKAATAIAYKLEEHFPEKESVEIARALYKYASGCGTDFASAKASYRLALLDVWRNDCDRVPELMTKVEQNPEASQFISRAKYWRAYCSEILGQKDSSREARESLLVQHPMSFHNLAANGNTAKSIDWITRETAPPIAFRSLVRPDLNGMIRSIETLIKVGSSDLAAEFADRAISKIQQTEPEVRLYIAALMHNTNHALAKFKIMTALFNDAPRTVSGPTMRLFFPLWFFDLVEPQSGEELDPLLVTALIRQESAFNIKAQSRVGARGLMQLMPATARMLAPVRKSKLFDPKTNIALGTLYLRKRLAQYNGDVELTLAAYNAGFARVDEWKRRYPTDNRILFIDLIPFKETRDYVSSILRNYYWYTKLYGAKVGAHQESANEETPNGDRQTASADEPSVTSNPASLPASIQGVDLSSVYQAITRAQSGLVRQPAAAPVKPAESAN